MSYPCRMTDPFLPIYDFEALEAEPDPIPTAAKSLAPAPKTLLEIILESNRRLVFDPVNYGCITIGTILNNSITTRPATALELAYDPYTLSYEVKDIK